MRINIPTLVKIPLHGALARRLTSRPSAGRRTTQKITPEKARPSTVSRRAQNTAQVFLSRNAQINNFVWPFLLPIRRRAAPTSHPLFVLHSLGGFLFLCELSRVLTVERRDRTTATVSEWDRQREREFVSSKSLPQSSCSWSGLRTPPRTASRPDALKCVNTHESRTKFSSGNKHSQNWTP